MIDFLAFLLLFFSTEPIEILEVKAAHPHLTERHFHLADGDNEEILPGDAYGMYYNKSDMIYIMEGLTYQWREHAMLHETGHQIWYTETTQEERTEYNALYEEHDWSPSQYGRTSTSENFAEVYSYIHGVKHEMYPPRCADESSSQQISFVINLTR